MHNCINIVSHPPESIGGVLIRAVAPLDSTSATHMRANYIRGSPSSTKPLKLRDQQLASGKTMSSLSLSPLSLYKLKSLLLFSVLLLSLLFLSLLLFLFFVLFSSGPGRVCRALDIDCDRFNARPILDPTSELFVAYSPEALLSSSSSSSSTTTSSSSPSFPLAVGDDEVVCTPRVRVGGEKQDRDIAWRFLLRDNSSVSEPKMFSVVNYTLNTEIDPQTNRGKEVKLVERTKTKTQTKNSSSSSSSSFSFSLSSFSVVKKSKVGENGKVLRHNRN
jgi:3-methyladenine DNA glycosylase Mpg